MKKLFILAAFAGSVLASCDKDYTCTCVTNGADEKETISGTKDEARKKCDDGDGQFENYTTECELDN